MECWYDGSQAHSAYVKPLMLLTLSTNADRGGRGCTPASWEPTPFPSILLFSSEWKINLTNLIPKNGFGWLELEMRKYTKTQTINRYSNNKKKKQIFKNWGKVLIWADVNWHSCNQQLKTTTTHNKMRSIQLLSV